MQVKVLNDAQLATQVFTEDSLVICIVDPEEAIPDAIGSDDSTATNVLFLDFKDQNPETQEQFDDYESHFNLEEVTEVLQSLEDPSIDVTYVYSTQTTARALAVAAGLLSATEKDCREVMYQIVSQDPTTHPNYWVVAMFDYMLGLSGKLTTAADDYLATGQVISKTGQVISSVSQ